MSASKVVVITGGGRGIGLAATRLFLENGYRVAIGDLDVTEASQLLSAEVKEKRVLLAKCDVRSEEETAAFFDQVLVEFGQVDSCIVNAGLLGEVRPWLETTAESVDAMYEVNVKGAFITAKYAVKAMVASPKGSHGGSLVFVSSVASTYGQPTMVGYVSSKWAVRGMSLVAAQEFAEYGVRANCIQPGVTSTPMFSLLPPAIQEATKAGNTLRREARPSEIAEVMYFLASDKSSYVNGSTVAVHAGATPA